MNASRSVASPWSCPAASTIKVFITAVRSWVASSAPRSLESSLLRYHSISATCTGKSAAAATNGRAVKPTSRMISASVRYTTCPLMMCATSCASTVRTPSRSSCSSAPEVITMNGVSKPIAIAFTSGDCVTYSCGRWCQSYTASTSVSSASSCGRCVGPTRTAFARKSCRSPFSPKYEKVFLTISSKKGIARRAFSAARSEGCSHDGEAISVRTMRSATEHSPLDGREGVLEISQKILDIFHATGEPNQPFRHAKSLAPLEFYRRVRHRGRVRDQRLDAAE